MTPQIDELQKQLNLHPLFSELNTLENVRVFMESHVWAVWDFMSLLKRLQRDVTCVELPWRPSAYSTKMVRFINQIVVGEESDLDAHGHPVSHFELYIGAMREVGANTTKIEKFLREGDWNLMPLHAREFTRGTLRTALEADTLTVAAAFFYGREKAIPGMFQTMLDTLRHSGVSCPRLDYYLERHIHVDGEEHGPLSEQCLEELCGGDAVKLKEAEAVGVASLKARLAFWDGTLLSLRSGNSLAL
jgi:hypothetical protein